MLVLFKSPKKVFPLRIFFSTLLLFLVAVSRLDTVAYGESEYAHLFATPSMYVATEVGEIFDIALDISNVENLHRCELTITYNTSVLDVIQVIRGDFFPQQATFGFVDNESYGFVTVNMSLPELYAPLDGDGTLACITFEVAQAPTTCIPSTLRLDQTQLYNPDSEPIEHNFVSAIFFWRSMLPDPPVGVGLLDLYTQRGGKGLDEPSGSFALGELVRLFSNVTYNSWPEQRSLVAFQVLDSLNQTVLLSIAETNEEGIAGMEFRIPDLPESVGLWIAISTAEVAGEVVWDTISFQVLIPVGGYSSLVKECATPNRLMPYVAAVTIAATVFILVKRKTSQENRMRGR